MISFLWVLPALGTAAVSHLYVSHAPLYFFLHPRPQVPAMIDGLVALQSSVDAARCALRVTSKPVANVISARATLTNAALVYLTTETKCVKFLKGRVEAAKVEIGKLEQEFSRYCTCTWGFQAPGCWGRWDVSLASVCLPAP